MSSMNHVILMGNLTRDPEMRKLPSGTAVADLSLAVSDNYKDKEGKTVDKTVFVDIAAWGRQAETCSEFLKKGSPITVEGKLQLDQWENGNGEKRSKLRVRASRVQFLSRPPDKKSEGTPSTKAEGAAPLTEEEVPF